MRRSLSALALTALLLALPRATAAAPQVLAALPSSAGVPLTCYEGICRADLSTYCLQRQRPAPKYGFAYVPARPDHFTLVIVDGQGGERRLPADQHLRFNESRGFMAVAATMKETDFRRLGAVRARIEVAEKATLLPVPYEGDPDPLTEKEIAYATGSLRSEGAQAVDNRPKADAAMLLARLTNAIPKQGVTPKGSLDHIWRQAIGDEMPMPASGAVALGQVKLAYENCEGRPGTYGWGGLKRCLEYRHDDLIRDLNIDYWQGQPGS